MTDDDSVAREAGETLVRRFMAAVARRGGKAVRHAQGVEVAASPEAAMEYIAKGTAWELAAGASGHKTRAAGRHQWQIAEAAIGGDAAAYVRWREYADVMPGTRSCVVTRHMAEKLGLAVEGDTEDEDVGDHMLTDDDRVVGTVPEPIWKKIMSLGLAGTFLSRIETMPAETPADFAAAVAVTEADVAAAEAGISRVRQRQAQARQAAAAADAAAMRAIVVRQAALRVESRSTGAGAVRREIASEIAWIASHGIEPPTPDEIVRALPRAA